MSTWLVILAVGVGSYGLRVGPLLVRNRSQVSARFDHVIRLAGTAALTSLVMTSSIRAGEGGGSWLPVLVALGLGLVVAARGGSMLRIVAVGLAAYALVELVVTRLW
jgi:branched-subunit amino acid transport protein